MTLARCTSPLTYRAQQLASKVPSDAGHQSQPPTSPNPTVNPTEEGLCALLTPQGICSLGSFLSHPAGMGRKERDGRWPLHLRAPHSTVSNTRAGRRHSSPANKHRAKRGEQEHRAELTWFEAKLGVRRRESRAKPHSRNLSRVRQLMQHGCEGQHKHPALESSTTGSGSCGRRKEGKFPVTGTGQGRLSAVRAGEGLRGCHGRGYKQNYHLPKRSESMRM